jgi:hypothetical protein
MNSTHPGRDTLVEVTDQTVVTSNQASGAAAPVVIALPIRFLR